MGSLLYGVPSSDPMTCAAVAAVLLSVGVLATLWPSARAARVDPMQALRHE